MFCFFFGIIVMLFNLTVLSHHLSVNVSISDGIVIDSKLYKSNPSFKIKIFEWFSSNFNDLQSIYWNVSWWIPVTLYFSDLYWIDPGIQNSPFLIVVLYKHAVFSSSFIE